MSESNDRTIDEATPDTQIGGGERFPISDNGEAKFATTEHVKDYVLAKIAELSVSSSINVDSDKVYILRDGVMKPIGAAMLASAVLDYGFGLAGVATVTGNELMSISDNGTKKTMTATQLKNWLASNILIPWSEMPETVQPVDIANEDLLVFRDVSADGNNKIKFSTFAGYVHRAFAGYLGSLTAVNTEGGESVSPSDVIYIVSGGVAKKATVGQLMAASGAGDVIGPASTTENKIPQWDSAQKKLKDGLTVVGTITDETASGSNIPTAGAVKTALDEINGGTVKTSGAQNVNGVKTFLASPVVPTPTQDMQAATKKYVDETIPGNVVDLTNNQSIGGVKNFLIPPTVPTPSADTNPATKKYVDDNCVKLTGAQEIAGVKTFGSSPVIPTAADGDNSTKAASTAWVVSKLTSWWNTVRGAAQSISGIWTFTASPVVPAPTQDTQAANKKYVDDTAVAKTGDQTVNGTKTFAASPLVPTVGDVTDDTQKAASTAFVKAAIAAIDSRMKIVDKSFVDGSLNLDDDAVNYVELSVIPDDDVLTEYVANVPVITQGRSRHFGILLDVASSDVGGSVKMKLSTGPTYYAEAADTFTIAKGTRNLIMFREVDENWFVVSRRLMGTSSTEFTEQSAQEV